MIGESFALQCDCLLCFFCGCIMPENGDPIDREDVGCPECRNYFECE